MSENIFYHYFFILISQYKICYMKKYGVLNFILCLLFLNLSHGGNNDKPKVKWVTRNIFHTDVFINNEGQFPMINGNPVLYKELRDNIYFLNNGLIFEVIEVKKEEKGFFKKEEEFKTNYYRYGYEFLGCNTNIKTELLDIQQAGYYTFFNSDKMFKGFKKIVYYNVWDGIDIEFTIHEETGLKYQFILHPGADINKIKIKVKAENNPKLDEYGNILIKTKINKDIIDHKPIALQGDKKIETSYDLKGNVIQFNVNGYDPNKTLIIDPWVIVPSALPANTGHDVDYDKNGNVYCSGPPMLLAKYNAAGAFQWTFTGNSPFGYYSEFCALPSGSTLWGQGFNSGGAYIYKISTNGIMQINAGPFSTQEVWTIFYNRCTGQVLGFGGGTSNSNNLQIVNDTNLTGGVVKNYNGQTGCCNDVVDAVIDANGDFFAIRVTATSPENLQKCAGPAYNPPLLFNVNLGYGYEECNCFQAPGIPLSTNRANALDLNSSYLYTYGGRTIKVWNKNTGALISSQIANAAYTDGVLRTCDGISVDECNNVYVGGMNTIHAYQFNGTSFTALTNISTPGAVYDLMLDESNGLIYAVGNGFLASYSVPVGLSFSLTMNPDLCNLCNGSINIINTSTCAVSSISFNINPGNISTTNTVIPNLCPQLYTVSVSMGCKGIIWQNTVNVTSTGSNLAVSFNINNPLCHGGTGSATVSPYNTSLGYTWQPAVGSGTLGTGLTPGIYTVNVSNGGNCSGSGTFQITQPPAISLTAAQVQSVSCFGGSNGIASATAGGGIGPYSYTWAPIGGNAATANNLSSGIYTITINDANNCGPVNNTVQIVEPPSLSLTASQVQSVSCFGGSNGIASATAGGGIGSYSYTWAPSGGNAATANNLSFGIYTITISDANNCGPLNTTVQINEPPSLSISASGQSVTCFGYSDGSATVNVSGGVGGYTYTWTPSGGNGNTANNLSSNTYTINVLDANNCPISTSILIDQPAPISLITAPDNTICYGNNTNVYVNVSGGTQPYSYNWNNGLPNSNGPHSVTLTTTTQFSVVVTDANNCQYSGSTNITVQPSLSAIGMQTSVCHASLVTVYPTLISPGNGGPYSYSWNSGQTTSVITVQGNLSLGSYNTYTVTISDGCSIPDAVAVVTINLYPNPVISFSAYPQSGCKPLKVFFEGFSNGTNDLFQWNFGNGLTSNQQNTSTTYTDIGAYTPTLTVTSDKGCVSYSFAPNYINVYPYPVADFYASSWTVSVIDPTVQLFNTSTGATTFSWSIYGGNTTLQSSQLNPTFYFDIAGTYTALLEVKNAFGCYDYILKHIYVEPEFHIYIPNTFTPNDDNINDVFFPKGIGISEKGYKMLIFDRWGELIFESREFKRGWDGTGRDGKKVKQDVYVYKIYVRDIKGKEHEFIGHVNCIR
jgi:gliding motility-associated-like protein